MEENNKIKSKIVHTYAEDMAQVIENEGGGLVKKIIHGEERHEAEKRNLSPESKRNKIFMAIGLVLIFLAVGILSYLITADQSKTVPVPPQFEPIIFHDQSSFIDVSGLVKDEVRQTITNRTSAVGVKSGEVEGIYLVENLPAQAGLSAQAGKQVIGLRRFLAMTQSNFVLPENPILVEDNFLMGVVNKRTDPAAAGREGFFLLIQMRSVADIFGSLRAWEGKMLSDLNQFIGVEISKDTNYLFTKNFEDGIVENKNARILYDKDGGIVLLYLFAGENSVIITDTRAAAREILLRLNASQKKQ